MRELSQCFAFCRFCHFSIYNSVRFLYISFTFSFTLLFFFFCLLAEPPPFLIGNLRHEWHPIDFKQFFLAKTLAKTCHRCHQNGKSLILKEFLFVKCGMSLLKNAQAQIIITSHCCILMQCYYI